MVTYMSLCNIVIKQIKEEINFEDYIDCNGDDIIDISDISSESEEGN